MRLLRVKGLVLEHTVGFSDSVSARTDVSRGRLGS